MELGTSELPLEGFGFVGGMGGRFSGCRSSSRTMRSCSACELTAHINGWLVVVSCDMIMEEEFDENNTGMRFPRSVDGEGGTDSSFDGIHSYLHI